MFSSKDLFFTPTSGAYTVSKSLRFRSSATAYFNRTPGSAANRQQYTISFWFKRGLLNTLMNICSTNGNGFTVQFSSSTATAADTLRVWEFASGAYIYHYVTTPVYRDPSAWYHCVIAVDGTTTTFTNSVKIYINGTQVTAFSTQVNPTATFSSDWNNNVPQNIGRNLNATNNYFDGYLAEFYNVPGQLTPNDFGAYDTNGVWQPAAYTGSYGTNGFYLKFTDVGSTTAGGANTGYGKDFAGTNNWTTNNFGTTSTLATYDSMLDSPTNAAGDIGNYCVLNPLNTSGGTISNANLTLTASSSSVGNMILGSVGSDSLKYYFEVTVTKPDNGYLVAGVQNIANAPYATLVIASTPSYQWIWRDDGTRANNGAASAYGSALSNGGTVAVAVDPAGGKIWWGSASGGTVTWFGSPAGDPTAGTNAAYSNLSGVVAPCVGTEGWVTAASVGNFNAGQRPFVGAIPSGFSALNTQNLTTPTITNGAQYMAAVTYTGTGSSQTITTSSSNSGNNPNGTTFQPDWVWVKGRSGATDHALYDAVRGVQLQLESNTTTVETTETTGLTAFTSSGFTTGALAQMNTNTATYVAWEWNAGGSTVTNTSGSITSSVRANTSAGFSVVTFTNPSGTSQGTVGHGLGVTPQLIIAKDRVTAGNLWVVFHASVCDTTSKYLSLSGTGGVATFSTIWGANLPTPSVFGVTAGGAGAANTNMIAYCFAPVAGYSAFGSYTGNGSADGPFIYTGFRSRWIMTKESSAAGNFWIIHDTSRDTYNAATLRLYPNASDAEATLTDYDVLSNGFKLRTTSTPNISGSTYIYAAFAENPFKISRAR